MSSAKVVLVVHGGAGSAASPSLTPDEEAPYREALADALQAGFQRLQNGGSSVDAVEAAIVVLEDGPLFNAGRGSVFTSDGRHELDASIMDGASQRAGAVAGVSVVRNPISAARAVMERSPHVLLAGPGADAFARECGLAIVEPSYFSTDRRRDELEAFLRREHAGASSGSNRSLGTVGAVALDRNGHLAAGTSTGGITGKRFGRVGDSPIPGAGTFADDARCAVSCTGQGEFFLRFVIAHEIASLVTYQGLTVAEAGHQVIHGTLARAGGQGGAIILDAQGRAAMPFHAQRMYRGAIDENGARRIAIFPD